MALQGDLRRSSSPVKRRRIQSPSYAAPTLVLRDLGGLLNATDPSTGSAEPTGSAGPNTGGLSAPTTGSSPDTDSSQPTGGNGGSPGLSSGDATGTSQNSGSPSPSPPPPSSPPVSPPPSSSPPTSSPPTSTPPSTPPSSPPPTSSSTPSSSSQSPSQSPGTSTSSHSSSSSNNTSGTSSGSSSSPTSNSQSSSGSSASQSSTTPSQNSTAPPPSGEYTSYITTYTVIQINGTPSTSFFTVPTMVGAPNSGVMNSATEERVIIGSVVGGLGFIALIALMFILYRRFQLKKPLFFFQRQPRRSMLLEGEDDEFLPPPSMAQTPYSDYPSSMSSHTHSFGAQGPFAEAMAARSTPSPHLLGLRSSDSGSIFQEAVWPPPQKPLVDPLVTSDHDDLNRIVDEVMGPSPPASPPASGSTANVSVFGSRSAAASTSTLPRAARPTYMGRTSDDAAAFPGHARSPSQTALLHHGGDSPVLGRAGPLFVTNLGSPGSPTSPGTPPPPSKIHWLDRPAGTTPRLTEEPEGEDLGELSMGEAL